MFFSSSFLNFPDVGSAASVMFPDAEGSFILLAAALARWEAGISLTGPEKPGKSQGPVVRAAATGRPGKNRVSAMFQREQTWWVEVKIFLAKDAKSTQPLGTKAQGKE